MVVAGPDSSLRNEILSYRRYEGKAGRIGGSGGYGSIEAHHMKALASLAENSTTNARLVRPKAQCARPETVRTAATPSTRSLRQFVRSAVRSGNLSGG